MKLTKAICILIICLFAVPAFAQMPTEATMDSVRDAMKAQKRAFIAVNMQLTEEEEGKFWPLYDAYQKELVSFNKRTAKLIEEYAENYQAMTDEKAKKLLKHFLDLEDDIQKARRLNVKKFKEVLPAIKVFRYFQLENKINAVIKFDLAENIPLMK